MSCDVIAYIVSLSTVWCKPRGLALVTLTFQIVWHSHLIVGIQRVKTHPIQSNPIHSNPSLDHQNNNNRVYDSLLVYNHAGKDDPTLLELLLNESTYLPEHIYYVALPIYSKVSVLVLIPAFSPCCLIMEQTMSPGKQYVLIMNKVVLE
jgi:hypothetical protein